MSLQFAGAKPDGLITGDLITGDLITGDLITGDLIADDLIAGTAAVTNSQGVACNPALETVAHQPPNIVDSLRDRIRKLETAQRSEHGSVISTGAERLDQILPEGGLAPGTVTEWLQPTGGCGAEILSLIAARNACHHSLQSHRRRTHLPQQQPGYPTRKRSKALVVIDPEGVFYPPAAVMWGIDLKQTIVIRDQASLKLSTGHSPNLTARRKSMSQILWAIHQALQCDAVGAVWGCLPELSQKWSRRFQLAAEQFGTMAMLVRPQKVSSQSSWAEVQWQIETDSGSPDHSPHSRKVDLQLIRARGGQAGTRASIEIDFTTGKLQLVPGNTTRSIVPNPPANTSSFSQPVRTHESHPLHLASQLAHPKTRRRAARA